MFVVGLNFVTANKQTATTFSFIARVGKSFSRIPTSGRLFLPAVPDLSPLQDRITSDDENDSMCRKGD